MSDEQRRKRLRDAIASGDEAAIERAAVELNRHGQGRHAKFVGQRVSMDGVRTSFRGTLDGVTELGGGVAILHMGKDTLALEALADDQNAVPIGETDIYSHYVGAVTRAFA